MKAVKVEEVQIKVEPSTTIKQKRVSASSPPNASDRSNGRKRAVKSEDENNNERGPALESTNRKTRRKVKLEPTVKIESTDQPKVEVKSVSISPQSPFPDFVRPTAEECRVSMRSPRPLKA